MKQEKIVELIKEEIEKERSSIFITANELGMTSLSSFLKGQLDVLENIEMFLEDIQKDIDGDLEEASERYADSNNYGLVRLFSERLKRSDIKKAFIRGAEWMFAHIDDNKKIEE